MAFLGREPTHKDVRLPQLPVAAAASTFAKNSTRHVTRQSKKRILGRRIIITPLSAAPPTIHKRIALRTCPATSALATWRCASTSSALAAWRGELHSPFVRKTQPGCGEAGNEIWSSRNIEY